MRDRPLAFDTLPITSATDLRRVMLAIRALETATSEQLHVRRAALERGFDFAWAASNRGDLQSYVKAAAAQVDELQAVVVTSEALIAT